MHVKYNRREITISVILAFLAALVFQMFFGIAYVSGASMEPAFQEGDILLLKKWGVPGNGEIVTAYIEELDRTVVKRVLAVGGDHITIARDGICLNGKKVMEAVSGGQEEQEIFLSPGQYFLIGDNQEISLDSRIFGCIEEKDVYGTVVCRLF